MERGCLLQSQKKRASEPSKAEMVKQTHVESKQNLTLLKHLCSLLYPSPEMRSWAPFLNPIQVILKRDWANKQKKDTSSAYRSNSIRSQCRLFSQAMPGLSLWLLEGNYPNPYISFTLSISLQQPHFICITSRLLPLLLRLPSMHTTSS